MQLMLCYKIVDLQNRQPGHQIWIINKYEEFDPGTVNRYGVSYCTTYSLL